MSRIKSVLVASGMQNIVASGHDRNTSGDALIISQKEGGGSFNTRD